MLLDPSAISASVFISRHRVYRPIYVIPKKYFQVIRQIFLFASASRRLIAALEPFFRRNDIKYSEYIAYKTVTYTQVAAIMTIATMPTIAPCMLAKETLKIAFSGRSSGQKALKAQASSLDAVNQSRE
ncbi:hypothetical protein J3P77_01010 [Pseudomonas sp. R1-18]|uniref:hypothetical protein n=1 Tax=Pseudomonas sp. R1-18 TaxID=1632772 RepID=UPI003DA818BC